MKCKLFFLALTLLTCSITAKSQVRCFDDPNVSVDMDIVAKSKSAILYLTTYSQTNQMPFDSYVVITFMNDSIQELTGYTHNDNAVIETDVNHGFVDRFISKTSMILKEKQVDMFQTGIKSIMIKMFPTSYYREWKTDFMGHALYERYLKSKENVMFKKKKKESPK
jgi:hypothetical protein